MSKKSQLECAFFLFIALLFLTVGAGTYAQLQWRVAFGGILLLGFFLGEKEWRSLPFKNLLFFFLLCFIGFEVLRSLWALGELAFRKMGGREVSPLFRYLTPPFWWAFYLGFFISSFSIFKVGSRLHQLLIVLALSGFFLALNGIPYFLTGWRGFGVEVARRGFFHPVFYSVAFFDKYLFYRFAHPNFTGDVIALGLFPALSLFFITLRGLKKKKEEGEEIEASDKFRDITSLIFLGIAAACIALASVLRLSRGTIVALSAASLFYLLALLIKYPSRAQWMAAALAFFLIGGFLVWGANLPRVQKEIQTIRLGDPRSEGGSFQTIYEGVQRAVAIYRATPLWGAGLDGYAKFAREFATPGTLGWVSDVSPLCHYAQVLAEEGLGAFFYFLFLLAYFLHALWGLIRTKSQFQFLASLALVAGVVMILVHASVGLLMERIPVATLVFISMGASLAALREDFEPR